MQRVNSTSATSERLPRDGEQLAIFVFKVGSESFGLPVMAIERIEPAVEISPLPDGPRAVIGVVSVHGTIVPVLDMRRRFGKGADAPAADDRLVLVNTASRRLAILADDVVGLMDVRGDSIADLSPLVTGAGLLKSIAAGHDDLIYIYDPDGMITETEETQLDLALSRSRS